MMRIDAYRPTVSTVYAQKVTYDESEDLPRSKQKNSFTVDGSRQGELTMNSPCPSLPGPIPTPDPPLPPDPSPFPGPPVTICQFTHLLSC